MPVVRAFLPENQENISALVKKLLASPPIHLFSPNQPNFLWVKAVQERLLTDTDLTG
jgi:hypothetical protein